MSFVDDMLSGLNQVADQVRAVGGELQTARESAIHESAEVEQKMKELLNSTTAQSQQLFERVEQMVQAAVTGVQESADGASQIESNMQLSREAIETFLASGSIPEVEAQMLNLVQASEQGAARLQQAGAAISHDANRAKELFEAGAITFNEIGQNIEGDLRQIDTMVDRGGQLRKQLANLDVDEPKRKIRELEREILSLKGRDKIGAIETAIEGLQGKTDPVSSQINEALSMLRSGQTDAASFQARIAQILDSLGRLQNTGTSALESLLETINQTVASGNAQGVDFGGGGPPDLGDAYLQGRL